MVVTLTQAHVEVPVVDMAKMGYICEIQVEIKANDAD